MPKLNDLVQELDDAYYDNRMAHLKAIQDLENYSARLDRLIQDVANGYWLESEDSRKAINELMEFVK